LPLLETPICVLSGIFEVNCDIQCRKKRRDQPHFLFFLTEFFLLNRNKLNFFNSERGMVKHLTHKEKADILAFRDKNFL